MNAFVSYLMDTNVVSETRRRHPDKHVVSFLARQPEPILFISVMTIGELRKGVVIRRLTDNAAAAALEAWVDGVETMFADRILSVDMRVARRWGELCADRSRPPVDMLIAATAIVHGLTLLTRNVGTFRNVDVSVVDPWSPQSH